MGNEVMAGNRLGGLRVSSRAMSFNGNAAAVEYALEHSLLWLKWRELVKASNTADPDVCMAMQREAADIGARMREVETQSRIAVNKAEKKGSGK